jgi:dephospho-CoA kinase
MTDLSSPRIIGLTGGIATGKSTVAQILAERYHPPVLDADILARVAVAPGSVVLANIFARFGTTIQQPDGTLNRAQLGQLIFQDPQSRQWLDAQIHPIVREQLAAGAKAAASQGSKTIVMVIPLLFEAKMTDLVTETWVVTCPPEIELQRLIARNQLSQAQAQARINSQMPLTEKVKLADVVIDNSGSPAALLPQVMAAWERFIQN